MTYKKCGFVLIAFLIVFIFVLSSCSYEDLIKKDDYEAKIQVAFDIEEDVKLFEDRLSALNITVISKISDGNIVCYCLESHYSMSSEEWDWLGNDYSCYVVDDNKKILLDESKVTKADFDGVYLNIYMDETFYDTLGEYDIFYSYLLIDDVLYDVLPVEEQRGFVQYLQKSDGTKQPLMQFAIAYASEPLQGDVDVTLIEQNKSTK